MNRAFQPNKVAFSFRKAGRVVTKTIRREIALPNVIAGEGNSRDVSDLAIIYLAGMLLQARATRKSADRVFGDAINAGDVQHVRELADRIVAEQVESDASVVEPDLIWTSAVQIWDDWKTAAHQIVNKFWPAIKEIADRLENNRHPSDDEVQ